MPYLPYEEPGITTILSLTSFLLLLNIVRYIIDRLLYCGIIGEILIGIIWGLPVGGTSWLSQETQETIQSYGYLGLIGLVFEGGLNTNLALLKKTVYMSVFVATIGLLMPIALSFTLLALPFNSGLGTLYPSPLAGFSAGASLCSTSLGTTFAILSSANMQKTRVGVVLVGAAMMDDVVGLVMVNIVTTLGSGGTGGWPIARPIVASFGMLLVTLALGPYFFRPVCRWVASYFQVGGVVISAENTKSSFLQTTTRAVQRIPHLSFLLSTAVLIVYVTMASFIDASVLFAAFIAGGVVSFLWGVQTEQLKDDTSLDDGPSKMYDEYYKAPMDYVLIPFFFVSYIPYPIHKRCARSLQFALKRAPFRLRLPCYLPAATRNIKNHHAKIYRAGINRLLHSHHKYVSRLNRVERNRLFDLDDSRQRSRQPRNLLRLLYEMVHNPQAQSPSTSSSRSDTKFPSRSPTNAASNDQETTTRNSSPCRLRNDLPRRNRLPNCIIVSKLRHPDIASTKWIWIRHYIIRRRDIPCYCLGSSHLYNRWTNWRRDCSQES
jgi:Kef-type K+ transport system membrane component KefB